MNKLRSLMLAGVLTSLALATTADAQGVPGQLMRFGTTGAYVPQAGDCLSILAINSSGQTATDSATPCAPVVLTAAYTNATAAFTAITVLPTVQGATTLRGECTLMWEDSSTAVTPTFAVQLSNAPTDLWINAVVSSGVYVVPTFTTITTTAQTAVASSLVTTTATTPYKLSLSFALVNGASPNTLTVYAESDSTSHTVTVLAGSYCSWVP
jgi:hypothetical protein